MVSKKKTTKKKKKKGVQKSYEDCTLEENRETMNNLNDAIDEEWDKVANGAGAAGTRVRKAFRELMKLSKVLRKQITIRKKQKKEGLL